MIWKALALSAAALFAAAAPNTSAQKSVAPKPAAVHPKPAAVDTDFDASNPSALIQLLASLEARAEIVRSDADAVMLKVTSPAGAFEVQFAGCDGHGRACAGLQFDAASTQRTATLAEINRFNQSSLTCRMIQDRDGKPHVIYSALASADKPQSDLLGDINAWRGCIADFGAFLKDPTGYLASAP
jgi:hypothetical protein